MSNTTYKFILENENSQATQHSLKLLDVDYLGSGVYTCEIQVNSNGFMCDRIFGFDNDEYFLAKLKAMLNNNEGEATLMEMQADSFLRLKHIDAETVLLTGYLVEQTDVTHSLEFSFTLDTKKVTTFVKAFEKMVRANI